MPVAGIAFGAGVNYATVDRIADAANLAYRERFLRSKLGQSIVVPDLVDIDREPDPASDT